jgi:hypothetical protein
MEIEWQIAVSVAANRKNNRLTADFCGYIYMEMKQNERLL